MRLTEPRRGRSRRALAIIAAPALIVGLATPMTASSATTSESNDNRTAVPTKKRTPYLSKAVNNSQSRMAGLRQYWTPERMANAVPADRLTRQALKHQTPASRARPEPVKPSTLAKPAAASGQNSAARRKLRKSKTIGKVFFRTARGVDMVCSGAAINSKRKNMVITAGHCLNGGRGKAWHRRWIFVPGYGPGRKARHGIYPATRLVALRGWIKRSNFNFDVGLALVKPGRGTKKRLVRKVGGYGLQTGKGFRRKVTAIGYSQVRFKGDKQKKCRRKTHRRPRTRQLAMRCRVLTPGASGGPWVKGRIRLKKGSRSFVNGVNSNINRPRRPTRIRSPYFGRAVRKMYRAYRTKAR
ncbi:MAG TPA: hypothetical protein VK059_07180 [Nocardioidaceae bacterium]|nr:hypothetical protein [Nocardioidaceae bacterium]